MFLVVSWNWGTASKWFHEPQLNLASPVPVSLSGGALFLEDKAVGIDLNLQ